MEEQTTTTFTVKVTALDPSEEVDVLDMEDVLRDGFPADYFQWTVTKVEVS